MIKLIYYPADQKTQTKFAPKGPNHISILLINFMLSIVFFTKATAKHYCCL